MMDAAGDRLSTVDLIVGKPITERDLRAAISKVTETTW